MQQYPRTLAAIRREIERHTPGTVASNLWKDEKSSPPLGYLLWMCDQIENMVTWKAIWHITKEKRSLLAFIGLYEKRGRWLGWVLREMESAGFWTNESSRTLVRQDLAW